MLAIYVTQPKVMTQNVQSNSLAARPGLLCGPGSPGHHRETLHLSCHPEIKLSCKNGGCFSAKEPVEDNT
jgi:hypothetical protein